MCIIFSRNIVSNLPAIQPRCQREKVYRTLQIYGLAFNRLGMSPKKFWTPYCKCQISPYLCVPLLKNSSLKQVNSPMKKRVFCESRDLSHSIWELPRAAIGMRTFFDMLDNLESELITNSRKWVFPKRRNYSNKKKAKKSKWWMPWLSEAMKDVVSCDKLRGGANDPWSVDFRMRKLPRLKVGDSAVMQKANPENWNI
jgi:hypothetical protein